MLVVRISPTKNMIDVASNEKSESEAFVIPGPNSLVVIRFHRGYSVCEKEIEQCSVSGPSHGGKDRVETMCALTGFNRESTSRHDSS